MRYAVLVAVALAAAGCNRNAGEQSGQALPAGPQEPSEPTPQSSAAVATHTHHVSLAPTAGNQVSGTLTLTAAGDAVTITGAVAGLAAGTGHGFHVHEKGDCSAADASSAGAHFNPSGQPHGNPESAAHHLGDMLNLQADAQGNAEVNVRMMDVTLGDGGPNDIVGKAIIVHEKPDDYTTQPSGDSGKRLACGVIE